MAAVRTTAQRGFVYGVAAYVLWGGFPLYWPLLEPASPIEILSNRVVWSLALAAVLLWRTRGWHRVGAVLRDRRQRTLLICAATIISVNWLTYIWGVNTHHVLETSLGYFINPLFTILLGVLVLREHLRRAHWVAVGIGTVAIVVLTVDYGRLPWIALVLAGTFGTYGYLKKQAGVGAVESLAVETGYLAGPALAVLVVLQLRGSLVLGHHSGANSVLLAGTGVITAVPLLFFAAAAIRLPLSTIGLLQYLAPVLQFVVGVTLAHEPIPPARLAGFALVWVALVILTVDGVRHSRRHVQDRAAGPVITASSAAPSGSPA